MERSTVMRTKNNYAAFYLRLSKEDNKPGESMSIENQRKILQQYIKNTDFLFWGEYVDDGFSGTSMNRPALNRMMRDIEDGKISIVLTKDFSRLGRNSGRVQILLDEFFTRNRVRYIAVSDGIDTMQPTSTSSIITPVLGFANELYAGDISRKIKASFGAKMINGDFIGAFAPYGYKKDSDNKNHLVPDEVSSEVIKGIFKMAKDGYSPHQIAETLAVRRIPTPLEYRGRKTDGKCEWHTGTVSKILRNEVYLGKTLQGKTNKPSFKSSYIYNVPKSDWICVENTHTPLVDKETWEIVRKKMQSRARKREKGFVNIFSGIAKCADCGKNMSTTATRKKGAAANLECGAYKLGGRKKCTNHIIDYNILYEAVLTALREQISLTAAERAEILNEMLRKSKSSKTDDTSDKLVVVKEKIRKLFEDKYSGLIDNESFDNLLNVFTDEKKKLEKKQEELIRKRRIENDENELRRRYKKFEGLISEYENMSELRPDILFKLIDRINVHQGVIKNGVKEQRIDIFFKFQCEPKVMEISPCTQTEPLS